MKILFVTSWLLLLPAAWLWNMGPGQKYLSRDNADRLLREAEKLAAEGQHQDAVMAYDEAIKLIGSDRVEELRPIRLQKAKSQMLAKQLPEAHGELTALVEELQKSVPSDDALLADARSTLANSQYYMTWLMRLEGLSRDIWEPEIESARQQYKLLAEQSMARGDSTAVRKHQEDLESAIRLARMDLGELQGLPLPSQ